MRCGGGGELCEVAEWRVRVGNDLGLQIQSSQIQLRRNYLPILDQIMLIFSIRLAPKV